MRFGTYFTIFLSLALGTGCTTTATGNQNLKSDRVSQIKKGVTTHAEVESWFGPPDTKTLIGNGRRMMLWHGGQASMDGSQGLYKYIPIAGGFIPSRDTMTMRRQTLQVILTKDDVVEDYEFSDKTSRTDTTITAFGGNVKETTTSNDAGK